MRITSDTLDGALAPQTGKAQETERLHVEEQRATAAAASGGADSVQISGLSARIRDVASADEARMAGRVAVLSAQYARGDYNPDPSILSRTLVSHALGAVDGDA